MSGPATPAPLAEMPETPALTKPAELPKGAKPVKPETKEKIRDLQVQQDGVLLAIKQNELDHDTLLKRSADFDTQIQAIAQADARQQKVDIEKYLLDVAKMQWVPKKDK